MPRTKVDKKNSALSPFAKKLCAEFETFAANMKQELEKENKMFISKLQTHLRAEKAQLPLTVLNKTIGELKELPPHWNGNVTSIIGLSRVDTSNCPTTVKKRNPVKRSSSLRDDEADSSNGNAGDRGRQSRSRARYLTAEKTKRSSRSLSVRKQNTTNLRSSRFKTPASKAPPNNYGLITPKVTPNTPQVLLRRPVQGEMALSLQGSPLYTGSVVSETVANINIPLEDGRLISIQPEKGLRFSQIPEIDPKTKKELQLLRENLEKICSMGNVH